MAYSLLTDIEHHMGIALITLSIIYLLIITIQKGRPILPFWFYLLNGLGGLLIFVEMFRQEKHFVYYSELVGFIVAFILFTHSFFYYK
jgi:hypothetical protein